MKVVHVGYYHPYDDIRILKKQCVSLSRNGYEVTYITSNRICDFTDEKYDNITIKVIKLKGGRFIRLFKYWKDLFRVLLAENADIYHFHEFELLPIARKLLRRDKKILYDMHEDVPRNMRPTLQKWFGKTLGKVVENLVEKYENRMIKKVDYNIGVIPVQGERVRELAGDFELIQNYPIYNGDNESFKAYAEKKDNIICFCGAIAEERGITYLVDALENLNGKLVLAGLITEEYLKFLKERKGWGNVQFLGKVSKNEVDDIYNASKVGICTYLNIPNHVNANPNKLFEYMNAGIPIVCTNFPSWIDAVENNGCGICVEPDNVNQVREAIEYIFSQPQIAEEMGNNGRVCVANKYNWQQEEKKLLNVYKKVAEKVG